MKTWQKRVGGWTPASLGQCYKQIDEATLLQVVPEPRKRWETIAQEIAAGSGTQ